MNAVDRDLLGTATANFFRALGGALVVAVFGAIVLGGGPRGPDLALERLDPAARTAVTLAFRWVFAAAAVGFALAFLAAMEERPLRSRAARPTDGSGPS